MVARTETFVTSTVVVGVVIVKVVVLAKSTDVVAIEKPKLVENGATVVPDTILLNEMAPAPGTIRVLAIGQEIDPLITADVASHVEQVIVVWPDASVVVGSIRYG
jgi:hypothetical protein